jgi:hypothetical protein
VADGASLISPTVVGQRRLTLIPHTGILYGAGGVDACMGTDPDNDAILTRLRHIEG